MDEQNNREDWPQPVPTMTRRRPCGCAYGFSGSPVPVLLEIGDRTACRQSEFGRLLKDRAVVVRIIIVAKSGIRGCRVHQTLRSVEAGGPGAVAFAGVCVPTHSGRVGNPARQWCGV